MIVTRLVRRKEQVEEAETCRLDTIINGRTVCGAWFQEERTKRPVYLSNAGCAYEYICVPGDLDRWWA